MKSLVVGASCTYVYSARCILEALLKTMLASPVAALHTRVRLLNITLSYVLNPAMHASVNASSIVFSVFSLLKEGMHACFIFFY